MSVPSDPPETPPVASPGPDEHNECEACNNTDESPICEGCGCCAECCNCTPTDCDCDVCVCRRDEDD